MNNLFFYLSWSNNVPDEIPTVPQKIASLNIIELQNHIRKEGVNFCFKYNFITDWSKCDDYLSNNIAIPLMSTKMKDIVNKFLINELLNFVWHDVKVKLSNNEYRIYFILEFKKRLNVLNKKKTKYESYLQRIMNGEVRKPVFEYEKIKNYNLFHQPNSINWKFPSALYVSEDLKKELIENKISGLTFSKALV